MELKRSLYIKVAVLGLGAALGWLLSAPPAPTVSVVQAFREVTDEDEVSDTTAVVQVHNRTEVRCTVWQCYVQCGCRGSVDGLPLRLGPGETGSVLLRIGIPKSQRYCRLNLISDAPEIDEYVTWDLTDVLEVTVPHRKAEGPIPDPMFSD